MGVTLHGNSGSRLTRRLRVSVLALALGASVLPATATAALAGDPTVPDIPDGVVEIYRWAAEDAACDLEWTLLAGLADVGSDHGRVGGATMDRTGRVTPEIYGLPLDGREGRRLIADTDGGALDGDEELDRAVGPFQFLPTTWAAVATDGNGDGVADPHSLWDAAASAATLLCSEGDLGAGDPVLAWYRTDAFTPLVRTASIDAAGTRRTRHWGSSQELGLLILGSETRVLPIGLQPQAEATAALTAASPTATSPTATSPTALPLETASASASSSLVPGDLFRAASLPLSPNSILVGDWDGDGNDEPQAATNVLGGEFLGSDAAQPVIGDWDGDGDDDAGVLEDGIFHLWVGDEVHRIDAALDEFDQDAAAAANGDAVALAGDWSGHGSDDLALAIPTGDGSTARLVFLRTGFGVGAPGERYGRSFEITAGDQLLAGDLDGDGIDSVLTVERAADGVTVTAHERDGLTTLDQVLSGELFAGLLAPGEQPAGLLAGSWPRALTAEAETLSFSSSGLPDPEFWIDATAADGTPLSLWWVGLPEHRIAVDQSLVVQTQAMIGAAAADGIELKGWGWRSFERQIELRIAHCADVWTTPASQCSPPTAIPGTSRHEVGLAIDFSDGISAISTGSPEFTWLSEHAADYGFWNLPSESWHWSVDGG